MIQACLAPLVRLLVREPAEAPSAGPYDSTTRTQHRTAVAAAALRPGRRTSGRAIRRQRHRLTPRRSGTTGPTPRRRAPRPGTWDSGHGGTGRARPAAWAGRWAPGCLGRHREVPEAPEVDAQ